MRAVELERMGEEEWREVIAGEPSPFGGAGEQLAWARKERHVGVRGTDGRLVAAAGVGVSHVRVGVTPPFAVAGIGGVIVTRAERGRGLGRMVIEHALAIAGELGPQRAMLFCLPRNTALYAKFGFLPVERTVRAHQPGRVVEVPMGAMWLALTAGVGWPEGDVVEVLGEPF